MPGSRDHREHRERRVEAFQRGIESADELLVPIMDLDDDAPEIVARRARIQARVADERARRALAIAVDVQGESWTRDQHRRFADQITHSWQRMQRRFYVLLITVTVALVVALLLFLQLFRVQQARDLRLDADLQRLAETMVISCETRNEQLRQSRSIYGQLASALELSPQTRLQAESLRNAELSLPDPVDCSRYQRIARGS